VTDPSSSRRGQLDRRAFLAGAGVVGVTVGAGAVTGWSAGSDASAATAGVADAYPYWGAHQAGIGTPAQDHLRFVSFDLQTDRRQDVVALLRSWTTAAAELCQGRPVAPIDDNLVGPPGDTGEAVGSGPSHLTITFGFGPGLFESAGTDRFGLADRRPAALADLPAFEGDRLEASRSGGDLAIQACADDPLVAFHAVHELARIGRGTVVPRWSQAGFGRTSSTTSAQQTPRNLMGMKDGTNNIRSDDQKAMDDQVWVGGAGPDWMMGGSYVVVRRIRILLELWDRSSLEDQQDTIGRHKISGAPLGAVHETDPVNLAALDLGGQPLIGSTAHIRVAAPSSNHGARILRRGYSFDDGIDPAGEQDAGLFFICYQNDPATHFVDIQRRLAADDALNTYIRHTASAVFACPGGVAPGEWIGQKLFASS
jgi:deferrochelatase/peroxidase EfeB